MLKKFLLLTLTGLIIAVLSACASDSSKPANVDVEITEDEKTDESKEITVIDDSLFKEVLNDSGLGDGDKLVNSSIENGELKAVIELGSNELLDAKDLAVSSYSSVSDELLNYGGWKDLTIEYVEVGTISMNVSEKKTNEFDMSYFPTAVIMEKLDKQ